jgi:hypothetical protein
MLSFILSCCLFTTTFQTVVPARDFSTAALKEDAAVLGNVVRGRFLAWFVNKGMQQGELRDILGMPQSICVSNTHESHVYIRLGVTIVYGHRYFEVAGEEHPQSGLVVRQVIVHSVSNRFPRLCSTRPAHAPDP